MNCLAHCTFRTLLLLVTFFATANAVAADAPQVVDMVPANGATDIDSDLKEMRVTFKRDMNTNGWSLCGGGPQYPKLLGGHRWIDKRTLAIKVRLEPNHTYMLSLNCPVAQNFRSAAGRPLASLRWTFKTAAKGSAPQVIKLFPEDGAADVKPGLIEMRVTFDQEMQTGGWSFCGGGPGYPEFVGRPKWRNKKTIVVKVKLKPKHDYMLLLNCPAAHNFQSITGVPLVPIPWSFSTTSKTPKPAGPKQKKLNARSLKQLMKLLHDEYAYYDYRGTDWPALLKKHRRKIIAATSSHAWVKRVAKMLSPLGDVHLSLSNKDKPTATFRRIVAPNETINGIKTLIPGLVKRNSILYAARTDDNIGYVLIISLAPEKKEDLQKVQDVFRTYRDCKAMVIDLRPNSGGDELLAREIAAWFVEGERVYAKNVYRDPDSDNGFGQVLSRSITGNKTPNRFDKPFAVLTGPAIMSSAEALLLMMKQGSHVTLVGASSFGSSGNPKPHELKNDVTVFIPSWKALRPDGSCFEGEGIRPDIEVKASPGAFRTGDPVLQRALKLLRKNDN